MKGCKSLSRSTSLFSRTVSWVCGRPAQRLTQAIQLASWRWTLNLESYDETTIRKFYLQHVGKAPEAAAGPNNPPINQAANQPKSDR